MNEATMFLHLILLLLVSLDIRQTQANKALHEETQRELRILRKRLEAVYRIDTNGDSQPQSPPQPL